MIPEYPKLIALMENDVTNITITQQDKVWNVYLQVWQYAGPHFELQELLENFRKQR